MPAELEPAGNGSVVAIKVYNKPVQKTTSGTVLTYQGAAMMKWRAGLTEKERGALEKAGITRLELTISGDPAKVEDEMLDGYFAALKGYFGAGKCKAIWTFPYSTWMEYLVYFHCQR